MGRSGFSLCLSRGARVAGRPASGSITAKPPISPPSRRGRSTQGGAFRASARCGVQPATIIVALRVKETDARHVRDTSQPMETKETDQVFGA